jgi:hypothetical protein
MNGIIHGCTHPAGMDIADGLSERDMMLGIMHCKYATLHTFSSPLFASLTNMPELFPTAHRLGSYHYTNRQAQSVRLHGD